MSNFDDLGTDLTKRIISTQFSHFQILSTTMLDSETFNDSIKRRKLLLYMYGALDSFIQDENFMQYALNTEEELAVFLSFKSDLLETLYINSLRSDSFTVNTDKKEIDSLFHLIDDRHLPEVQFEIVLMGGNETIKFRNNPDSAMFIALKLKRIINSNSNEDSLFNSPTDLERTKMQDSENYYDTNDDDDLPF